MSFWRANERAITVISVLIGALVFWELVARVLDIPQFLLPAPSVVIAEIFKAPGLYAINSLATLRVTLTGFGLAVVLGILFSVAIVHSRIMEHSLYTLLVALNSLPKVALAPLFVIWLGTGSPSKTTVAVTIAIFPIVIDTTLGLRSIEPDVMNMEGNARLTLADSPPHSFPARAAGTVCRHESRNLAGVGWYYRRRVCRRRRRPGQRNPRRARNFRYCAGLRLHRAARCARHHPVLYNRFSRAAADALAPFAAAARHSR